MVWAHWKNEAGRKIAPGWEFASTWKVEANKECMAMCKLDCGSTWEWKQHVFLSEPHFISMCWLFCSCKWQKVRMGLCRILDVRLSTSMHEDSHSFMLWEFQQFYNTFVQTQTSWPSKSKQSLTAPLSINNTRSAWTKTGPTCDAMSILNTNYDLPLQTSPRYTIYCFYTCSPASDHGHECWEMDCTWWSLSSLATQRALHYGVHSAFHAQTLMADRSNQSCTSKHRSRSYSEAQCLAQGHQHVA